MRHLITVWLSIAFVSTASAQIVISGNENKIDLIMGAPRVIPATAPDSISIIDFSKNPPAVQHLSDIPNSVVGPPSNIAITPDGSLALIANSLKVDPQNRTNWIPESFVHILDLKTRQIIGRVSTDLQPSGISISSDGKLALVANRAAGTVSVLSIQGRNVRNIQTVKVCEPKESVSDIAIHPNGRLALASIQKGGYLLALKIDGQTVTATERKISAYGQPYRCIITPDGALALTAGLGYGNAVDADAVSVIDLSLNPYKTVDYIPVGSVPESLEISPDGKLLAAVVMNGSNLAASDPNHSERGAVVLLARKGKTFVKVDSLTVGRIPEGVAFTSDGRNLVVQCHPDRELWVLAIQGKKIKDTGRRIAVPGMPSSLRASLHR